MEIQTDAEHVQELRDSAAEAQAARNEVITEIARLTTALRQAEAERDAARADAERLASSISAFIHSRRSDTGLSEYDRIIRELETAFAAHVAASGTEPVEVSANAQKAVTP